jgi:hypothetical protein
MSDGVFRSKSQSVEESQPITSFEVGDGTSVKNITEEPPYTDYEKVHNHPFTVDYFKLGDTWEDKLGGFKKEIDTIEGYFRERIEHGEIQNDIKAIKTHLDKIYKLSNIDKTERVTMQIEKLTAYIEYLQKLEKSELNHYKYATRT